MVFSLYSMCPIKDYYRVIYRRRFTSQVQILSKPLQRLYSRNIPGHTRNFSITVASGLQLRWALLSQAPSSRKSASLYSPKTIRPSLASSGTSPPRPHSIFGELTEDLHVLRSSFALLRSPLGVRVPSTSRPKVVSPTVAPQNLGPSLGGAWLRPCGHRSSGRRSAVHAILQKISHIFAEETKFSELVC